jgi:hypothetical protein
MENAFGLEKTKLSSELEVFEIKILLDLSLSSNCPKASYHYRIIAAKQHSFVQRSESLSSFHQVHVDIENLKDSNNGRVVCIDMILFAQIKL